MQGPGQPPPPVGPPPPSGQPPPIDSSLLRPRARWYWLSALPFLVGLAAMTVFIVLAVKAFPGDPEDFNAPGGLSVILDKGEKKTIYRTDDYGDAPGEPRCRVIGASERRLELEDAGSLTITVDGDRYAAEYDFEAPTDGTYRIECLPQRGRDRQFLAVGDDVAFASFGLAIAGAIASPILGLLLSAVMAIVVAIRRSSHKSRLQAAARPGPTAPP
jgi:hypothetical protein